jgi:Rrf2 family iron-sulfur cluster assembly transcriptional regulator
MLTRSGVHAIRALIVLSSLPSGEFRGTSAIADETGAPRNYLGKLLLTLARAGLVESQKGLGGGFRLARDPSTITLYDIVEAIEDVNRWRECAFGGRGCSEETPCAIHSRWAHVRDQYLSLLRNTSLAVLAANAAAEDARQAALLAAVVSATAATV